MYGEIIGLTEGKGFEIGRRVVVGGKSYVRYTNTTEEA